MIRMIRRADCHPTILAGLCITCVHALLRDMGRSVLDAEIKRSIPKNETVNFKRYLNTEKCNMIYVK